MIVWMTKSATSLKIMDKESHDRAAAAINTIVWGIPGAMIILGLVGFFVTKNISRPLQEMAEAAKFMATGDLSFDFSTYKRQDEVGQLASTFRPDDPLSTGDVGCGASDCFRKFSGDRQASLGKGCPRSIHGHDGSEYAAASGIHYHRYQFLDRRRPVRLWRPQLRLPPGRPRPLRR